MKDKYYLVGIRENDGSITLLGAEDESCNDISPLNIAQAVYQKKRIGKRCSIFELQEKRIKRK